MRKIAKILSVALALTMIFAVCVMPASAEDAVNTYDEHVTARVVATPDGKNSSDLQIYKIEVYFDSSNSFQNLHMFLSWDNSAFQLLRATKADLPNMALANANMVIDKADPDSPFYEGTAYTENEGFYMGEGVFESEGVALFPNDAGQPALSKISDGALGATLLGEGYTGLYWNWEAPFDQNALLLSGGDRNGFDPHPLAGEQKILTFYLREKADAKPGTYTVGMNERQVSRLEGTYTWNDDVDSKSIGFGAFSSFNTKADYYQDSWYNITNAQIQIGSEAQGPKVEYKGGQYKMTATSAEAVADEFQFRVISKISDADWNTYLANTGSSEDNNCVTKLGFVAYKGAEGFDMDQAKAAAKAGETQGNYYVATTNYIKHTDGSDAEFAARIDTTKTTCDDATCIAFVQYKDADGTEQYAFYDAEYKAQLKTNYDSLVQKYLATNPFKG